jgi:ABC-2 type transport system permease protein
VRRVLAQARLELALTLRRGESLLVVLVIPVGVLAFFTVVDVLPDAGLRPVDFLVPGVLALSIIASAMTSLGIATGFERQTGVLRRLGTTPLGREGLLLAKLLSLGAVVAVQLVVVALAGYALGWEPSVAALTVLALVVLGVVTFASLGFFMAGRLRAETNLAMANGLFLVFLLLGGIIVPLTQLPDTVATVARLLPAEALATGVRDALTGAGTEGRVFITLGVWAVLCSALSLRTFRWDDN